jgi:hypothetical protein
MISRWGIAAIGYRTSLSIRLLGPTVLVRLAENICWKTHAPNGGPVRARPVSTKRLKGIANAVSIWLCGRTDQKAGTERFCTWEHELQMKNRGRIIVAILFAFLSGSALPASTKQDQIIPAPRSMRYTSRSTDEGMAWQRDVRGKLFQLLKLDDLILKRSSIPLSPKELSRADRGTYHVKEIEISSTRSRRIRIIVTVPRIKDGPVPAVVCVGGHGSNLYSPYAKTNMYRVAMRLRSCS